MKQFQNTAIFLFFFLLLIYKDAIAHAFDSYNQKMVPDETLVISYQNLLEKYQKINQYLELQPEKEEIRIHSKVLFRDPFDFFGNITIAKGHKDGIEENSAVLSNEGLLGVVTNVTDHTSQVRLLTNHQTTISVKCKDAFGILETNSKKELWIKNLTKETTVEIGNQITTSGLTEIPGNILVGTVEEIKKDSLGLIQSIKVKPISNFDEVSYVSILYQARES